MHRSSLPIVDPCTERFDWGTGGSTRYCEHCDKSVHNLSQMTRREAEQFLDEHAGQKVCVQYSVDRAGSLTFKPRPRSAFMAIASLALAACTGVGDAYELETPDDGPMCFDAMGQVVGCDEGEGLRIPIVQEGESAGAQEEQGCPIPAPQPDVEHVRGEVSMDPPPPGGMMVPTRAERREMERRHRAAQRRATR